MCGCLRMVRNKEAYSTYSQELIFSGLKSLLSYKSFGETSASKIAKD